MNRRGLGKNYDVDVALYRTFLIVLSVTSIWKVSGKYIPKGLDY
jgi:phage shock protein PspC (stress-responsive transcriptional regulator)